MLSEIEVSPHFVLQKITLIPAETH